MNLKLTKEMALELHRRMWSDMKDELGDCPSLRDRDIFKYNWCKEHFPNDNDIENCCFLCEYTRQRDENCDRCLIRWSEYEGIGCVLGEVNHHSSPISTILALPARG